MSAAARSARSVAVALVLLEGARAVAQGVPPGARAPYAATRTDDARDEARAWFQRGVAYIAAERWADAITELERARDLRVTPPVQYNLGLAYRAVGRNRDAIASFRGFILAQDAVSAGLAARVGAYIRELASGLGRVEVQVEPASARLFVDGVAAPSREPVEVDPGRHVIMAEAEGYAAETRAVEVRPGSQTSWRICLTPLALSSRAVASGDHRSVLSSPWLWLGVGVTVVGAGLATYFLLQESPVPYRGSLGTVTGAVTVGSWP